MKTALSLNSQSAFRVCCNDFKTLRNIAENCSKTGHFQIQKICSHRGNCQYLGKERRSGMLLFRAKSDRHAQKEYHRKPCRKGGHQETIRPQEPRCSDER